MTVLKLMNVGMQSLMHLTYVMCLM